MSLTGTAVGTILKIAAPALAKTLLDNLGIGDKLTNKLLEQTIDAAVDVIPEGRQRQALEQQIQKLAIRLQVEMKPLFEQEVRNLNQSDQNAIFLAVSEALLKGNLSLDELMNIGLDARRLTKQLLKTEPVIIERYSFSENHKSLYRQAIAFSSASLIEIIPQLEGFQLSVTQTTLRQMEELIDSVQAKGLSESLLRLIAEKSLIEHQRRFGKKKEIIRELHSSVLDLVERPNVSLIGLRGSSGVGKSTLLRQVGESLNTCGDIAIWVSQDIVGSSVLLPELLSKVLRRFEPALEENCGSDALYLIPSLSCNLVLIGLDDIEHGSLKDNFL